MLVKQISVFLENKSGRLYEVTSVLSESNINISALSIADTTDFGILRLIINKPEEAEKILKEKGFTVSTTDVIGIIVPDEPGGLSEALKIFNDKNISIEYLYAFAGNQKGEALVILRVEEPEKAIKLLDNSKINIIKASTLYNM